MGFRGFRRTSSGWASGESSTSRWAGSATFGGLLPCTGFHTDGRYARGRLLIDRGGAVVVATNFNPGSAPSYAMPFALALAVRGCGLTPGEAIAAATLNAATLLGQPDRGAIGVGQRADLVLLRHRDERALAYEVGGDPIAAVIAGGQAVRMEG